MKLDNQIEKRTDSQGPDPALEGGSNYDPFSNTDTSDPLNDNDYSKTIAGLEDIVVPGRGSKRHHHNEEGHHYPNGGGGGEEDEEGEGEATKAQEKEGRMGGRGDGRMGMGGRKAGWEEGKTLFEVAGLPSSSRATANAERGKSPSPRSPLALMS